MQKKRFILRKWFERVLQFLLGGWVFFVATTIDSVDLTCYTTYDKILVIWTILALISFHLLSKYTHCFDCNYID